jgi:glycogen phosphorylase
MTQETTAPNADEVAAFRENVISKLTYSIGKDPEHASDHDWFEAVALATRDRMIDQWMDRTRQGYREGKKRVYYLSLEFLIGRLLTDSLSNLGLLDVAREALAGVDVDFERIRVLEPDAALGNGGLGRLAACFMESMATLGVAAHGYGIRYDHGLFRQAIVDGWQHEQTETWLNFGNPWEFERPEVSYLIGFGGSVAAMPSDGGSSDQPKHFWHWAEGVRAIAYDTPVVGWRGLALTLCVCGVLGPRRTSIWNASTPAITSVRSLRKRALKAFPVFCIPPTAPKRGRSCVCARSISSLRHLCRTCCAGTWISAAR